MKMIYVYLAILLFYVLLFFLSAKEKIPYRKAETEHKTYPAEPLFLKMAVYCNKLHGKKGRQKEESAKKQIAQKLKLLNPALSERQQTEQFYLQRNAQLLAVFFLGNLFCLCIAASSILQGALQKENTQEGSYMYRNAYGQGEKELTLEAQIEGEEEKKQISYTLEERLYSKEEIEILHQQAADVLEQVMLGNNERLEQVVENLTLPEKLEGFPFTIYWESDNYSLVQTDGTVNNEELAKAQLVNLTAHMQYEDMQWEEVYILQVNPAVYSKEELWIKEIHKALNEENEKSKTQEVMYLPKRVGERTVTWKEVVEDGSSYFFFLLCISVILVYYHKGREIEVDLEKRNKELMLDYAEIINKVILYMGAGMTMRNAFFKMGEDYKKKENGNRKRYVYEEILLLCYELQSGVYETEAYLHFGRRCQLQPYMKLCTLLSQNLKKGSNDLMEMLRQEAANAFTERKNTAKKLGEEAGTKLLLPMMMMLCIVMVMIMIPAYFSFTG